MIAIFPQLLILESSGGLGLGGCALVGRHATMPALAVSFPRRRALAEAEPSDDAKTTLAGFGSPETATARFTRRWWHLRADVALADAVSSRQPATVPAARAEAAPALAASWVVRMRLGGTGRSCAG